MAPETPATASTRILRCPEVIARTGLSRPTIWRRIRAATFPAPVQLGPNTIGWYESDIEQFLSSRPRVNYAPALA